MAVKQPITYNNIKYDSLADLCREYNMMGSYENISVYKKYHNISLEEAFTRYLNNTYKGNKNGVMIKINNNNPSSPQAIHLIHLRQLKSIFNVISKIVVSYH